VVLRGWLLLAPFAAWFLWRAWAQRTGREMGSTPWPWLFAAGAVLLGGSVMVGAVFHPDNRDEAYVPAEVGAGGQVIPGYFQHPAPARK
jgi:hypothetical protein